MLLEVNNIYKSYIKHLGIFRKERIKILKGISFTVDRGECLGIIGESGSGKSTLARIIIGIEEMDRGNIIINGITLKRSTAGLLKQHASIVFQDYSSSVDPLFKVFEIVAEPILLHDKSSRKDIKNRIVDLLIKVGLSEKYLGRYPHELSGGELQRVCIARAISTNPEIVVLDEAVSSLDSAVQVQILDLLIKLKKETGVAYIFISHDLMTITYMCERVLFFKDGKIVEEVEDINRLNCVNKEYSKKLLHAAKTMLLEDNKREYN